MTVKELMQKHTPQTDYEGWTTNDDYVLAVGINLSESATEGDYTVVQMGIAGLDAQLNPITVDKTYIRAGQSSMKTGSQRAFKSTGDRYIGDAFQDYVFSHDIKFGTGNKVVVPYVYFNILNGKGEKGKVSIIVNSDGSGNAGESSGIDVDLKKTGDAPTEFTYSGSTGA